MVWVRRTHGLGELADPEVEGQRLNNQEHAEGEQESHVLSLKPPTRFLVRHVVAGLDRSFSRGFHFATAAEPNGQEHPEKP
jgi:hypothetical protein